MTSLEQIKKDYESHHELYTDFLKELRKRLKVILQQHEITKTAEISHRIKTFESIEQNINNYKFKPKIPANLGLITDLAGIRIALLFKRHVDPICNSIEQVFEIKEKKLIFHEDDQFGYTSVHYEVSLKRNSCPIDLFYRFGALIAEIQVRTLAQHLWAAAAHYLNYKERKDVGKPLQRPLSRISALLELIDQEYDRLLNLKEEYIRNANISDSAELLNRDLLIKILKDEFPPNKGFAHDENMNVILADLSLFGIKTVKDFRDFLNKQKTKVLSGQEMGFATLQKVEPDAKFAPVTFSIQGIVNMMLQNEFDKKDGSLEFFDKVNHLPPGTTQQILSDFLKKKEAENENKT
jgi:putative GTP pyrophosphokinase